ncbi:hypothetical protein [Gordonia aquimaris]|uniref:Uncharacterized protein n=1 Tax=Gordonia aquimaris TaxID=2984863 RepID=A0A9X3D226_9ACTN|nr:hypothetical protein [Gordonia aquimaris]MCX2963214.1 hypothetical protein [Gordonia aquimaris]
MIAKLAGPPDPRDHFSGTVAVELSSQARVLHEGDRGPDRPVGTE